MIIRIINLTLILTLLLSFIHIARTSMDQSTPVPGGDSYQYFNTAYNLAQYNVHDYDRNEKPRPSFYREPFYSYLVSIVYRAMGLNEKVNLDCLHNDIETCGKFVLGGKILNFIFLILMVLSAFWVLNYFKVNKILIYILLIIIVNNPLIIEYLNEFLTEVLASLLFILASFSFYRIIFTKNIKIKTIIIYGLLFTFLVMTKFVYFFAIYIVALIFISLYIVKKIFNWKNIHWSLIYSINFRAISMFLIIILIVPTLWKVRNFSQLGFYELSPRGYGGAVTQRLEYLTMTDKEKSAGHWLYFFNSKIKKEALSKIDNKNLSRFELSCEDPENWYCKTSSDEGQVLSRMDPMKRNVFYEIKDESIAVLLENLGKHMGLVPLFLQRGTINIINDLYKVEDRNYYITIFYKYLIFISYLLIPLSLIYSIRVRNYELIILAFPLLYHYSIYSLLTHFEPRYSALTINYIFIYNTIFLNKLIMEKKWNLTKKK